MIPSNQRIGGGNRRGDPSTPTRKARRGPRSWVARAEQAPPLREDGMAGRRATPIGLGKCPAERSRREVELANFIIRGEASIVPWRLQQQLTVEC